MKTFKQFLREYESDHLTVDPNTPNVKKIIESLKEAPWNLIHQHDTPQKIYLTRTPFNEHVTRQLGVEIDYNSLWVTFPQIQTEYQRHETSWEGTTSNLIHLRPTQKRPTLKLYFQMQDKIIRPGGPIENLTGHSADVLLHYSETFDLYWETYNIYNTTPGTDADKTIAVLQRLDISRQDQLEILKDFGEITADRIQDADLGDLL